MNLERYLSSKFQQEGLNQKTMAIRHPVAIESQWRKNEKRLNGITGCGRATFYL